MCEPMTVVTKEIKKVIGGFGMQGVKNGSWGVGTR